MSVLAPTDGRFLDGLTVKHGPARQLGEFFLAADDMLHRHGISLSFATFDELMAVNAANSDSWLPLLPAFDPACCNLSPDRAFCWLGRDTAGKVVVTQAGRLFDWHDTSFYDAAGSLRLMYDDPDRDRRPGESAVITAEKTRVITGRVAYSGAVWWHPSRRGSQLPALMSRLSRLYALTTWDVDFASGIMSAEVFGGGLARKTGHFNVDWSLSMANTRWGDFRWAILWMTRQELEKEVSAYVASLAGTEVDAVVKKRRADQN